MIAIMNFIKIWKNRNLKKIGMTLPQFPLNWLTSTEGTEASGENRNRSSMQRAAKNIQRAEYGSERATRRNDEPLVASSEIEQWAPISLFK